MCAIKTMICALALLYSATDQIRLAFDRGSTAFQKGGVAVRAPPLLYIVPKTIRFYTLEPFLHSKPCSIVVV